MSIYFLENFHQFEELSNTFENYKTFINDKKAWKQEKVKVGTYEYNKLEISHKNTHDKDYISSNKKKYWFRKFEDLPLAKNIKKMK